MTALKSLRLAALIGLAILCSSAAAVSQTAGLVLETVSNRADLVSGGDVLIRADAGVLRVENGQAPNLSQLSILSMERPGQALVLVTGLQAGKNVLTLTSGGRSVSIDVINHPNGGPLFSGPQIQPWACLPGSSGPQCDRASTFTWSYMPKGGTTFKPYSPAAPAADVATVTTPEGKTLPYIVRVETFNQNRSGVAVAALYDPAKSWSPLMPQAQWNKGVLVLQGSGCGTGYGEQPAGSPLNDNALKKGFLVVTVALLHNTINCNPIVQAEAAIMAKEHVAETYGPFDLIFGMGSSGGAISQIADQNAYPGLYDGLILNHLFSDSDASRRAAYDCRIINEAWGKPGSLPITDAQKVAVAGMLSGCASAPTRYEIYAPGIGTGCDVPEAQKFNAATNPKGVRCTLQDYEVNQVGRRPDGYANGRIDNEGVQYGLNALKAGAITPAQFVELNAAVGGHDINLSRTKTRTVADRAGLARLYQTGIANTENNLSATPIIETRVLATDFHQVFNAIMVRARLDRAQGGDHGNYALWRSMTPRDPSFDTAFDVMTTWIRAIKADKRNVPQAQKVRDNRPPTAHDRCTLGDGKDQPMSACTRPPELARALAGAPDTNDSGKCVLKPLKAADYGAIKFSAEQWASLNATFPTGVCDYAKPMVDFRMTTPWLTYSGEGKAQPLGPAPKSYVAK
ncbi:DUF6351 family protein [soil metagenome]